jgi:hypothetical protein
MFSFCHHCGGPINQNQIVGQRLFCRSCKKEIGIVEADDPDRIVVDKTEALIQSGKVAQCPECQRLVEIREKKGRRSLAPHMGAGPSRMCIFSGKPAPAIPAPDDAPQRPATSKDLSGYVTKEIITVVACGKTGEPTFERLTLEYLDRTDRVRVQIDAVRDILGGGFRMANYPAALKRPHLAVWSAPTRCVVARRHPQGGYEPMPDSDLPALAEELRQHRKLFFA